MDALRVLSMRKDIAAATAWLAAGLLLAAPLRAQTLEPEALKRLMERKKVLLIDLRDPLQYEREHIPGARSLPQYDVERLRLSKREDLALYCSGIGCPLSGDAAKKLRAMGYEKVRILEGGLEAWKKKGYPVASGAGPALKLAPKKEVPPSLPQTPPAPVIAPSELKTLLGAGQKVLILDVRPDFEYAAGHIRGAVSMPLEMMDGKLGALKPEGTVVVYDAQAKRSRAAREKAAKAVLVPVRELAGGIQVWSATGGGVDVGQAKGDECKTCSL